LLEKNELEEKANKKVRKKEKKKNFWRKEHINGIAIKQN